MRRTECKIMLSLILIVLVISGAAFLSWLLSLGQYTNLGTDLIPMAPSSAL